MQIEHIGLENFKPFGSRQVAQLAPLTLIFGPNSTGKSSLIQSLLLMRQSLEVPDGASASLIARGELVDLGSYTSMVFQHDLTRELRLAYAFSTEDQPDQSRMPGVEGGHYGVQLGFRAGKALAGVPELSTVRYSIRQEVPGLDCGLVQIDENGAGCYVPMGDSIFKFADQPSRESLARYVEAQALKAGDPPREQGWADAVIAASEVQGARLLPRRLIPAPSSLEGGERHEAFYARYATMLSRVARACNQTFRAISYLGPLRSYPARYHLGGSGLHDSVGSRGEHAPDLIFRSRKDVTKSINRWFEAFEIPYTLAVQSIGNELTGDLVVLSLLDKRTNVRVTPSDVGFGIGQLLPVLVEGVLSKRRMICVEQPEIHLHPRLQAHLADFMIETAGLRPPGKSARRPVNQWIVETHSESLMLRVQRRIREGKLSPRDVSVLYVEPAGAEGSRILSLRLNEQGEFLDEWPAGFFEEGYRELFGEGAR